MDLNLDLQYLRHFQGTGPLRRRGAKMFNKEEEQSIKETWGREQRAQHHFID
jgi:hypothetical protein